MNIKNEFIILSIFLILISSFFVGCDSLNLEFEDDLQNQETNLDNDEKVVNINEKIFNSEFPKPYDQIEILEEINPDTYLVRTKRETLSDSYFIYNLEDDKWFNLPTGIDYVNNYEIINENDIKFYMDGTNSESSYHDVPFIIECFKTLNENNEPYYMGVEKEMYFPITESINFGGKSGHKLNEIVFTLDGIQFAFGPEDENDPNYFAAYTIVPYTKIYYKEDKNEIILEFNDTKLDNKLNKSILKTVENNTYIKLIELKEVDQNVQVIINFEKYNEDYKNVGYYNAKIGSSVKIPAFLEINFVNEKPKI